MIILWDITVKYPGERNYSVCIDRGVVTPPPVINRYIMAL